MMLIALYKLECYVFGISFILETDIRVLVDQFNNIISDLLGSFV